MPSRVVLLGASNLTMSLPTVLGLVRARLGPGPLEVLVAAGHGRAYGRWSRVGLRGLPPILDCGLWDRAAAPGGAPTHALVTDIGNDLAYGSPPADVARAVGDAVARLHAAGARSTVTLLPARSLARLRPWQYHVFKAILFPGRRMPIAALHARVAELNERLAGLAAGVGATLVDPSPAWYRADAIHIAPGRRANAWPAILAGWGPGPPGAAPAPLRCRGLAPAFRTLAGIPRRRPQPCAVLADGATISLY